MKTRIALAAPLAALGLAGLPGVALGQQIIQDNFTGASVTYNWIPFLGACLTAGQGPTSSTASDAGSTVLGCTDPAFTYYTETLVGGYSGTLPDPVGNGALRFTNGSPGGYAQAGGVVSGFTFPSGQGLQVTFTTITYRGNSGGTGADGADGMSFFLTDGGYAQYDLGAFGGSLGYTCSNVNNDSKLHPDGTTRHYDGMRHAYLGLGIDEYGNFLNPGDNTASGPGYQWNRIGLRGAGDVAWRSLTTNYPSYYPSTLADSQTAAAVQKTCTTGQVWNYSGDTLTDAQAAAGSVYTPTLVPSTTATINDYLQIPGAYQVLPTTTQIAAEAAATRGQAVPITYLLKITQSGLLSFSYSYNGGAYQPVITAQSITASNGALPASFRFGFAGSTGGSTNIHEVVCFQAQPADTSASSAGINEQQTAKVQTGSQVYLAFYNPTNWTGTVTAQNLLVDPTTGLVTVAPTANWDAGCVLTGIASGGTCLSTGVTGPVAAEGPTARTILTWNPVTGQGVPFEWSNITTAQQNLLDAGDASPGTANRLNYLRGDRTNEINAVGVGLYRNRVSVLADIIDSSPTWVGPPQQSYGATWQDLLYPTATAPENAGPTYPSFQTSAGTRTNVVYAGANDGLLHGFRSGAYNSAGNYTTSSSQPNDGYEVLAYMPSAVISTIHSTSNPQIDYSNAQYGHNFYVDGPPSSGDLYYQSAWHTWLIGGLGPGGNAIYALDITNPANFSETNATSIVFGEWSASTITCANVANCGNYLGQTYGTPQIRRFHNGAWGAVFGNGLNTATGAAGIFVMTVAPSSGAVTFYYLSTGDSVAPTGSSQGNGIAYASPADLDGDHIVDYVYAGDVKGNLWRFDLTSNNPASWAVTAGGPLFTTPGNQPITTKVIVAASAASSGAVRVVVDFGTGQITPITNSSPSTYASGTQSLYGIWDWNMNSWNSKSATQYATQTGPVTITTGSLVQQQVLTSVPASSGYRAVTAYPVCWAGSTACATGNTQYGWYLNLPGTGEQIVFNPVLEVGAFIVNTTIPPTNSPTSCIASLASGWTMAIDPISGGSFSQSFFGDQTGHFVNYNGQVVSGLALSGTGSVSIVTTGTGTFLVTQTYQGTPQTPPINPLANNAAQRLTWAQRR